MISFTDVLHNLVRRGLTLRIDQAGNLFIYDPQHTAVHGAAKAEGAAAAEDARSAKSTTAMAGAKGDEKSAQARAARHDTALAAHAPEPAMKPAAVAEKGAAAKHAPGLAARGPAPSLPVPGSPVFDASGPQWRGITWQDVPGHDESVQKLNFALLRRGMLSGHKCCRRLEGEALKDRLQELSQRNRGNSQFRKEQSHLRHNKPTSRPLPP